MKRYWFICFLVSLSIVVYSTKGYARQQDKERLRAFRAVKTMRLLVYEFGDTTRVNLPFKEVARRLLGYAGVTIVGAGAKKYDCTLQIHVYGIRAISEVRRFAGVVEISYTRDFIDVTISLEKPGVPVYREFFNDFKDPLTSEEIKQITGTIEEMLGQMYGTNFWIAALKDIDVREKAAEVLKDIRAVEPLIAALKGQDVDVREKAAELLGKIKDIRAVEPLIACSAPHLLDTKLTVLNEL